jgi:hypothetical protein
MPIGCNFCVVEESIRCVPAKSLQSVQQDRASASVDLFLFLSICRRQQDVCQLLPSNRGLDPKQRASSRSHGRLFFASRFVVRRRFFVCSFSRRFVRSFVCSSVRFVSTGASQAHFVSQAPLSYYNQNNKRSKRESKKVGLDSGLFLLAWIEGVVLLSLCGGEKVSIWVNGQRLI